MGAKKTISWTYPTEDSEVSEFEVWVREASIDADTLGKSLGTRVAVVAGKERSYDVVQEEGRYLGFVVPVFKDGTKGDALEADAVDFIESGRDTPPPSDPPANPAIAAVDSSSQVRVVEDPPKLTDPPHVTQVVEGGADPLQGKVVAESSPVPGGPMAPNASRQATAPAPVEGCEGDANMPSTRDLWQRPVTPYGLAAATPSKVSVPVVPRPNHDAIAVCSVVGAALVGLPAPGVAESWEVDATDGLRLKSMGTGASADPSWTGTSGAFVEQSLSCAPYFQKATILFDEKDLGAAALMFVLECFDQVQRKTLVSPAWATMTGDAMGYPSAPAIDVRGREANPVESPWWAMRQLTGEGKPTQPLRACKWQYVCGASSPLPIGEAYWHDYVPGETLLGRYVRVRLKLVEPTGFHQVIVPKALVTARVLMRRMTGTGSPETIVTAGPGSLYTDKGTGALYHKSTGYGNTGWQQVSTSGVPAGVYVPFAGPRANIPAGWLACDGSSYATAAYPALFAAIGYTWGGAGPVFSVPDLRTRYPKGATIDADLVPGGNATHSHPGSVVAVAVTGIPAVGAAPGGVPVKGNPDPGHNHGLALAADSNDPPNAGAYYIIRT